jgi:hypothetical protein
MAWGETKRSYCFSKIDTQGGAYIHLGSFVTAKESPNDVDILLVMSEDFQIETVPEECKHLFDYIRARVKFNADVFWSKASIGEDTLSLWLETYQLTRDFKRRGIVEVKLS